MPVESMHPVFARVAAGHFREGPEYATWRASGTSDFLLIHTVSGAGRFGEREVRQGDAALLRPGVRHDYGTAPGAENWEFMFAHFHPRADWMPLLDWPNGGALPGVIHAEGEVHHRATAALRRVTRMQRGALPRAELFAVNALEEALLWLDTQNPLSARTDERVMRVMEFVAVHLAEPLDVDRLAAVVHLSASRLTHLFTEHLGRSPQRYVERERMLLAEQLLGLTGRSVAAIARETGWDDPLYFSQRFRRHSGLSPSEFRRAVTRS